MIDPEKYQGMTGMTFNPLAVPQGKFIWEEYKVLSRRPALSQLPKSEDYQGWLKTDLDQLVRFMVVFVDPESPLASETDFDFRKKEAIDSMKVKGRALEEIESEGLLFHAVLLDIFKLANSYQYESWFSLKMNFHILNRELRKNPEVIDAQTMNARRMLAQSQEESLGVLAKIESTLFPSKRIEKLVNQAAMADEIGGYAEEFATDAEWKGDV